MPNTIKTATREYDTHTSLSGVANSAAITLRLQLVRKQIEEWKHSLQNS